MIVISDNKISDDIYIGLIKKNYCKNVLYCYWEYVPKNSFSAVCQRVNSKFEILCVCVNLRWISSQFIDIYLV